MSTHVNNQLQTLQGSAHIREPCAENAATKIGIRLDRVLVAIELAEHPPEEETRVARNATHYITKQTK